MFRDQAPSLTPSTDTLEHKDRETASSTLVHRPCFTGSILTPALTFHWGQAAAPTASQEPLASLPSSGHTLVMPTACATVKWHHRHHGCSSFEHCLCLPQADLLGVRPSRQALCFLTAFQHHGLQHLALAREVMEQSTPGGIPAGP